MVALTSVCPSAEPQSKVTYQSKDHQDLITFQHTVVNKSQDKGPRIITSQTSCSRYGHAINLHLRSRMTTNRNQHYDETNNTFIPNPVFNR